MSNKEVVILAGCRTPIGSFGQSLRDVKAFQLAALVMGEALKRAGVAGDMLDDVIFGDCIQTSEEANTARTAALKAGIPVEVPATTIQRQCASGMQATIFASQQILAGDSEMVLAGGCESMSNAPYVLKAPLGLSAPTRRDDGLDVGTPPFGKPASGRRIHHGTDGGEPSREIQHIARRPGPDCL